MVSKSLLNARVGEQLKLNPRQLLIHLSPAQAMKPYQHSPYVGITRLVFTTTLMFLAGILAWWSWTHTGLGGLRYALVGAIVVAAAAPFILVWFRKNTDANGR